jgi:hypothetical protein
MSEKLAAQAVHFKEQRWREARAMVAALIAFVCAMLAGFFFARRFAQNVTEIFD